MTEKLDGYLQHEAAYIVLRDRGEPMTTDAIAAEMGRRCYLFWGQYPASNVHRSMQKQAKRDGCYSYRDGKWSIEKAKTIAPL